MPEGERASPPGVLAAERFVRVATGGLGQPQATAARAMAWFRGRLFVGASAAGPRGPDDRARVLVHDPATGAWSTAYESPLIPPDPRLRARAGAWGRGAEAERPWPREFGIRSMLVAQARGDAAPCLYLGTMGLGGGLVLRSEDGRLFVPVTAPGLGDDRRLSVRGLAVLDGRLFAAPAGLAEAGALDRHLGPDATVHVACDPASGDWRAAASPGFGDPVNGAVLALGVAYGHLYAGTLAPARGFQLWRTRAEGPAPFDWERVLADGAQRHVLNPGVAAMAEFGGDLILGTGLSDATVAPDAGAPAAAEILRLREDGSWDLLAGEPRFTPDGLKVPLSGLGPGLGDPFAFAAWSLAAHEGALYAGMLGDEGAVAARTAAAGVGPGGFALWATTDGVGWTRVLAGGHGRAASTGIAAMASTPAGLFLGAACEARRLVRLAPEGTALPGGDLDQGFEVLRGA